MNAKTNAYIYNGSSNVMPHHYNGAEAIAKGIMNIPKLFFFTCELFVLDEIEQAQQDMWSLYTEDLRTRLNKIGEENGRITPEDMMTAIGETNMKMAELEPKKVSFFTIPGRQIKPSDAQGVIMAVYYTGVHRDFDVDVMGYHELVGNTVFLPSSTERTPQEIADSNANKELVDPTGERYEKIDLTR